MKDKLIREILYNIFVLIIGMVIGWLNPIEGPLDWTYDEYASHKALRHPQSASPRVEDNTEPNVQEFYEEYYEDNKEDDDTKVFFWFQPILK